MTRCLLLLDVTQMAGNGVCVAGLDLASCETIRLNHPGPSLGLLADLRGLLPGEIVQVDSEPSLHLSAPHLEDHVWSPRSLRKLDLAAIQDIRAAVRGTTFTALTEAFGEQLPGGVGNSAWAAGRGTRSLATLEVRYVRCSVGGGGKPRVAFRDSRGDYYDSVPFQDLRVKMHACDQCADELASSLRAEFDNNRTLIRVGLTRASVPEDDPKCWLQVTNIFARERTHFV